VKRYHVTTFGCQMNAHDSERIKGMLEELGLGEATEQAEADVLVFNTCTIRERPDQRFAAHLAQARALKKRDPEKVIAVGGCYAEAQQERLFSLYPYVDVAFGPGSIPHLGEWLGTGGVGIERGAFGTGEVDWKSFMAVVRRNPETGRDALYVNRQYTVGLHEWWPTEDRCILVERPAVVAVGPISGTWHGEVRPRWNLDRPPIEYRDGWPVHPAATTT